MRLTLSGGPLMIAACVVLSGCGDPPAGATAQDAKGLTPGDPANGGSGSAAQTTDAPGGAPKAENEDGAALSGAPAVAVDGASTPPGGDPEMPANDPAEEGAPEAATGDPSQPDDPGETDEQVPPGDEPIEEPVEVSCPSPALEPGEQAASLMHDGLEREFLIHVPPGYDNTQPVPLVLNFHGATSNAEQQRSLFSQMDATADDKGFIVVYPQGIGNSWNAGACCGDAAGRDVDDVGFGRAMVEYMAQRACIDTKRVYASGFSNGGRMSYRLGCEAADVFAAIAPVAGTKSFPDLSNSPGCEPSRPLSLIDFMGSADSRVSAQPGQVREWVGFNGCTDTEPTEVYRSGEHLCEAYTECQGGTSVTYCIVDGGGHCWPGTTPCPLGSTSGASDLSANELMWELFERSSL